MMNSELTMMNSELTMMNSEFKMMNSVIQNAGGEGPSSDVADPHKPRAEGFLKKHHVFCI